MFDSKERIVRIIYSTKQVDPKTKDLKPQLFHFRLNPDTGKLELSTLRYELANLNFIREIGPIANDASQKRIYYGLACAKVAELLALKEYSIAFTPNLKEEPKNPFHCDIYDNVGVPPEKGVARSAQDNLRTDNLKKLWSCYSDGEIINKDIVQPLVR